MITCSEAISACEERKQPDRALDLSEAMQRQGLESGIMDRI